MPALALRPLREFRSETGMYPKVSDEISFFPRAGIYGGEICGRAVLCLNGSEWGDGADNFSDDCVFPVQVPPWQKCKSQTCPTSPNLNRGHVDHHSIFVNDG